MTVKNVARATIQGGRHESYKVRRDETKTRRRMYELAFIRNADWEGTLLPKERPATPDFKDRLGPLKRYLHSKVGQPWNAVYSDIRTRFDVRTTAGRHIVYGHLLKDVWGAPQRRMSDPTGARINAPFEVRDDGVLHHRRQNERRQSTPTVVLDTTKVVTWLAGRAIGLVGRRLYWLTPANASVTVTVDGGPKVTNGGWKYFVPYGVTYANPIDRMGYPVSKVSFRQNEELTKTDKEFFLTLPEEARKSILEHR